MLNPHDRCEVLIVDPWTSSRERRRVDKQSRRGHTIKYEGGEQGRGGGREGAEKWMGRVFVRKGEKEV